MNKTILTARDIHKSYVMGAHKLRVLRGASVEVRQGEYLAVMGASGSGKSTLLHILGALDLPDQGTVNFENRDVFSQPTAAREAMRCDDIGFVFQFYHLLPELNVLENVLMPRMVNATIFSWLQKKVQARAAASELIERVGLTQRIKHRPNELSGGERQRTAIARALVNNPKLLLADEPTGNLDGTTGDGILELLKELNSDGQTIVMVTHDPKSASYADRIVHLDDGRLQLQ
jgi:ABC-type lipoprotein export system ATPase subunit